MSLERKVRLVTESLARTVDRRKFLKGAGNVLFGGLAAVAAGHLTLGRVKASDWSPAGGPQCAPPGPYCNIGTGPLSGCYGGSCFQHLYNGQIRQCRVYYTYYQAGCWTTPVTGGRWTCCDCECPQPSPRVTCGCAQFSTQPYPRPDGPLRGASD
jgi:hypothetical protein